MPDRCLAITVAALFVSVLAGHLFGFEFFAGAMAGA